MKVACPHCSAAYNIDDRRIPATGLNVKCPKCQGAFPVRPVAESAGAVPLPAPPPAASPGAVPLPAPPSAAAVAPPPLPRGAVPLPPPMPSARPAPPPVPPPAGAVPLPPPLAAGRAAAIAPPPEPFGDVPFEAETFGDPGAGAPAAEGPFAASDDAFAAADGPFAAETPFAAAETPFAAMDAPFAATVQPAAPPPPPAFAPQDPLPSAPPAPLGFGEVDFGDPAPPPAEAEPFQVPPPDDDPFARIEPPPSAAPRGQRGPPAEELEMLFGEGEQRKAAPPPQGGFKVRRRSGKVFGPFQDGQIVEMLTKGELLGNEDVSSDGGASWSPIGTVAVFGEAMRALTATPEELAAPVAGRPAPPPVSAGVPFGDRMAAAKVTEGQAGGGRLRLPAFPGLAALPRWGKAVAVGLAVLLVVGVGAAGAFTRHGWFFYKAFRGRGDVTRVAALVGQARAALAVGDVTSVRSAIDRAGQAVAADDGDAKALATYVVAVAALDQLHAAKPDQVARARGLAAQLGKEAEGNPATALAAAGVAGLDGAGGPAVRSAEQALEQALAKAPPDPEALALLAARALERGDAPRAAGFYQRLEAVQPGTPRAALGLARAAARQGDLAAAKAGAEKALAASKDLPPARLELAVLAERRGELEVARDTVQPLLAKEAEGLLAPRERARALALSAGLHGRHAAEAAAAEQDFQAAVEADPKLTETRLASAAWRLKRGDPAAAVKVMEPLQGGAAADPAQAELLIRGLAGTGRALDATRLATQALAAAPGDPRLLMARAAIHEQASEREPAVALYRQALERAPDDVRPRVAIGRLALAARDLAGAAKELEAAAAKAPQHPEVQAALGDLRLAEGKPAEAEAAYQAALRADPEFARAEIGLAQLAQTRGETGAARAGLERALAVEPRNAPGHAALGLLLWKAGDLPAAEKALATAVGLAPADALARIRLGAVKLERGDTAGALADTEAGVGLTPGLPEGQHWLGRALLARGETAAALQRLQKAVDLERGNAVYRLHLGLGQERSNQRNDAVESYRAAAAADPKFAEPLERLGQLFASFERCDQAIPEFEKALQVAPGVTRVKLALADCRLRTRKGAEAVRLYREVLKDDPAAVQALYKLARAVHETQGAAAAFPWYERAAREEPSNPMPHYYLGYLLKERGAKPKAVQAFKAYLALKPDADDKTDIVREIEDLGGTP